ncbi:hypothetical protein SK128_003505 [Halocaridina rubra]|uniref:GTPase Era, mitochondrial n=1 Tax=Halocaridina rubra TaxID=373956 RepID=A0AAN8X2S7_HALRR
MWVSRNVFNSVLSLSHCRVSLAATRTLSFRADRPEAVWDGMYHRGVPRTMEEMSEMLKSKVDSPPDAHLLKVAIVGVPNCGKSTLINNLMGWRVCSVSSKVHTTRISARAVLNNGSTQIVFLDTPGLVSPLEVSKHKLERTMMTESEISLHSVDLVAVLHDMSNHYTCNALHSRVLRLLALYPKVPSILILNKLDLVKSKSRLLESTSILTCESVGGNQAKGERQAKEVLDKEALIRKTLVLEKQKGQQNVPKTIETKRFTEEDVFKGRVQLTEQEVMEFIKERQGWPLFQEVFMISGLKGLGVEDLKDYLLTSAKRAPWIFGSQVVTDQNPEEIALMAVREKFLDTFKEEIPYEVNFRIEHWDLTEADLLYISVKVGCKRQGLTGFIIGYRGQRVAAIAREAEQELRNTFRTEVKLRINVEYDASLQKK